MASGDIKVTKERLDRFLNAKTTPICEICEENKWDIVKGSDGIEHKHFVGTSQAGILTFDCFITVCMNCGNTRTYAANVVKKWLKINSAQ